MNPLVHMEVKNTDCVMQYNIYAIKLPYGN